MKSKVMPLRIPESLDLIADMCATEQHTGAEKYLLNMVSDERISIGRAAEILDTTIHDLHDLAMKYGVELGPTEEQMKRSMATLDTLLAAKRVPRIAEE